MWSKSKVHTERGKDLCDRSSQSTQLSHKYTVYPVTRFISLVQKCSMSDGDVLEVEAGDTSDFDLEVPG